MTQTQKRRDQADFSLAVRLPPSSVEAEQSLLGSLLLSNQAIETVADLICDTDFYRDDHRRIYRHVVRLLDKGCPADVVTVFESLQKSNEHEQAGGFAYLAEIANNTGSAANAKRYAEIVRERAILRRLLSAGNTIAEVASAPAGRDVRDLLDQAESLVLSIAEETSKGQGGLQQIRPFLSETVERIQAQMDAGGDLTGTPTGFHDFDQLTSGLQPGDLVIVAGRPSMGKTTLALNIAEHVALGENKPVAVFSMEMPGTQLAMRLLCSVGKLDQQRVRSGRLSDDEWGRLTYALGKLHDGNIHIDETPALTINEVRARARRLDRQCGGLGLLVIDYLQLMSGQRERENRATELSEISRGVKALAKELGVPIIALSQLSRSVEQRTNKRPVMSDLRESGAIEQDADLIAFIYRDEVYNPDSEDRGTAEVIIAKQRNGPIGNVRLTFLGEYTRFENFARA